MRGEKVQSTLGKDNTDVGCNDKLAKEDRNTEAKYKWNNEAHVGHIRAGLTISDSNHTGEVNLK